MIFSHQKKEQHRTLIKGRGKGTAKNLNWTERPVPASFPQRTLINITCVNDTQFRFSFKLSTPSRLTEHQIILFQDMTKSSTSTSTSSNKNKNSRKFLNAKLYINQIKLAYADSPHNKFLSIANSYKSNQIDTIGVIVHVTQLLFQEGGTKNKRNLVLGLNNFLPNGYEIMVSEHDRAVSFCTPSRSKFTRIPMVKQEEEEVFSPTHIIPTTSNGTAAADSTKLARQEDDGFTNRPIEPPSRHETKHQEKFEEHVLNPVHTMPTRPKERVTQKGKHSNVIMLIEQHQLKQAVSDLRRSPRFRLTELKRGSELKHSLLGKRKTMETNRQMLKSSPRLMELKRRRIQIADAS